MENFLLNPDFLKQIDLSSNKTIYARITALNIDELPLETIEGYVTGGSISCNGDSAIRRTCSISLISNNSICTDIYWALKNKFKVEIGVLNEINDQKYDKILWFKQGVYVINSFSKSHQATSIAINISGQDKMCLINGTMGGALPFEVNFSDYDLIASDGSTTKHKVPIVDIIKESLLNYAKELENNIIINNLDDLVGWELWNYRGNTPLYAYYKVLRDSKGVVQGLKLSNLSIDNTKKLIRKSTQKSYIISNLPDKAFYTNNNIINQQSLGWAFQGSNNTKNEYVIKKIEYGEDAGYHKTDLTYAGELVLKPGEPLTKVFDSIISQLGIYEYFYDIDGRFVFQKKKFYTQGTFKPIAGDNVKSSMVINTPKYSYEFSDNKLITSLSNNPNVTEIKNSFSIWGKKKGLSGNEINIHTRFAIQKKPKQYISLSNKIKYTTSGTNAVDWRELIYQMAIDYNKYGKNSNYAKKLVESNPIYYGGKTGYEQYYIDMLGFWRTIYDGKKFIVNNPSSLVFWIDFIEPYGQLENYDISIIGERIKVDNNSSIKAMWYEDIPEIEFVLKDEKSDYNNGYEKFQLPKNYEKFFSISARGVSMFDRADELINQHVLNANLISISTIPIYYLEPNSKIYVKDIESDIDGDYILSSFSLPLTHNGTMSITAKKIIKDFII